MLNRLCLVLAMFSLLIFIPSSNQAQEPFQNSALISNEQSQPQRSGTVYVCACLKTRSCDCMTEAKMEGPCACGREGGPPMKAVPSDSDWAKTNRDALAK
jgi:hypothetical protein